MKLQQTTYQHLKLINVIAMLAVASFGFIFPLGLVASLVLIPSFLLSQIALHAYIDQKQRKVLYKAKIHTLHPCCGKIYSSFKKVA